MFHGLTRKGCCEFAYQYADRNNKKIPHSWVVNEMAGFAWFSGFIQRKQTLALRIPEATSIARAVSFNKFNVELFFSNLKSVFQQHHIPPHMIFNIDETGLSTVQKCRKVVSERGLKQVGQITSAERGTLVTLCCCVNATGQSLPPVYVFPRVNFKQYMLNGAPANSLGLAAQSGWMNSELFIEAFAHFVKYMKASKENPGLVIMDNHKSHLSLEVASIARENGISIVTFPPHCSHRMQPLDVSVYGPLKAYYYTECNHWMMQHPGTPLTIYQLAELSGKAYLRASTPMNIVSGFKKTGIFPYDENVFPDSHFLPAEVSNQGKEFAMDEDVGQDEHVDTAVPPSASSQIDSTFTNASTSLTPVRPSRSANDDIPSLSNNTSHTNPTFVGLTPEQLRPYPKTKPRKSQPNRKRMRSAIITDSPVKNLLSKVKPSRQPNSSKSKPKPGKKIAFLQSSPKDVASSSESEVDQELICDNSPEISSEEFSDDGLDTENVTLPQIGDYVIAKFVQKRILYFVGKVVKDKDDDDDYEISFLRKHPKCNGFVDPFLEDLHSVPCSDVVMVLPPPHLGTTKRTEGIKKFAVNLSAFNL